MSFLESLLDEYYREPEPTPWSEDAVALLRGEYEAQINDLEETIEGLTNAAETALNTLEKALGIVLKNEDYKSLCADYAVAIIKSLDYLRKVRDGH